MIPFVRNEGSDLIPSWRVYEHKNCPGISNLASEQNFPIINTLLSIPHSLLHTLPRLAGIVPLSMFQEQLIIMGTEISRLWWWDPSPEMKNKLEEIRLRNIAANQHDDTRTAKPNSIHHSSRSGTTFLTMQPVITYGPPIAQSSGPNRNRNQGTCTFQLSSGQIVLGVTPPLSWDGDGLQFTLRDEGLAEVVNVQCADKGVAASIIGLSVTTEAWDVQTIEGTEDLDDVDCIGDAEKKPGTCLSSFDIVSWRDQVVKSGAEPPSLTPSPFERGTIGGQSGNDILMIKGLIHPPVYTQFLDLRSFSYP